MRTPLLRATAHLHSSFFNSFFNSYYCKLIIMTVKNERDLMCPLQTGVYVIKSFTYELGVNSAILGFKDIYEV